MKLKADFILSEVGDTWVLVPVGEASQHLHGIVRLNETAAFLVGMLRQGTTSQAMSQALLAEYDVDEETAQKSVAATLSTLSDIGALEDE